MADFQYILPGAVGLPQGSNLYLWNRHIICGRTSMCNVHQSSVRGVTRVPGVDGGFALRGDSRELSDRPGGLLWRDKELLDSVMTLLQVRSHGTAEVANGGHVTVRIASALDTADSLHFRRAYSQGIENFIGS